MKSKHMNLRMKGEKVGFVAWFPNIRRGTLPKQTSLYATKISAIKTSPREFYKKK